MQYTKHCAAVLQTTTLLGQETKPLQVVLVLALHLLEAEDPRMKLLPGGISSQRGCLIGRKSVSDLCTKESRARKFQRERNTRAMRHLPTQMKTTSAQSTYRLVTWTHFSLLDWITRNVATGHPTPHHQLTMSVAVTRTSQLQVPSIGAVTNSISIFTLDTLTKKNKHTGWDGFPCRFCNLQTMKLKWYDIPVLRRCLENDWDPYSRLL